MDDFHPLQNVARGKIGSTGDEEPTDQINTMFHLAAAITCEIADNGNPKQRENGFADIYMDDEDKARKILNFYWKYVSGMPKKFNQDFYKAAGTLFAAIIKFMSRNRLKFQQQIMSSQQSRCFTDDMSDKEKEMIVQRREMPNFRASIVTIIGFYQNNKDEGIITKIRKNILKKQRIANRDAYRVSYITI